MNIEGTPHEKALLVVCAYIIGFVSAYIAFAHAYPSNHSQSIVTYVPSLPEQTAAVIASQSNNEIALPEVNEVGSTTEQNLVYENQGLYLYGNEDEPMLLSKAAAAVDLAYTDSMLLTDKQGFHSQLPAHKLFTEQNIVYFCESYEDIESCVPYIYNLSDKTLRVIQNDSGPISLSVADAESVTVATPGIFKFGEYTSTSLAKPWHVSSQ